MKIKVNIKSDIRSVNRTNQSTNIFLDRFFFSEFELMIFYDENEIIEIEAFRDS